MEDEESSRGNGDCDGECLCGGLEFLSVKVSESSCVSNFVLGSKDFDVCLRWGEFFKVHNFCDDGVTYCEVSDGDVGVELVRGRSVSKDDD